MQRKVHMNPFIVRNPTSETTLQDSCTVK